MILYGKRENPQPENALRQQNPAENYEKR